MKKQKKSVTEKNGYVIGDRNHVKQEDSHFLDILYTSVIQNLFCGPDVTVVTRDLFLKAIFGLHG